VALVYFVAIWYILWQHLVYFVAIWYTYFVVIWNMFSSFGMLYQQKSGNPVHDLSILSDCKDWLIAG
jgi:hypothetical protein